MSWKDRIRVGRVGRPHIGETSVEVATVLDELASGESVEAVLRRHPEITREDVLACVAFGAEMARRAGPTVEPEAREAPGAVAGARIGAIRREEVLGLAEYERVREERRRAIIELKRPRRVSVGPDVTFIFETRETALFQIQEILRAEGIVAEEAIRHEIEVYDILVPRPGELRATMMIEIPDREERNRRLPELVGIEEAVSMWVGEHRVVPRFHDWRETTRRASPVNYAIFALGEAERRAFSDPAIPVRLCIDHPRYRAEATLGAQTRASLAEGLGG